MERFLLYRNGIKDIKWFICFDEKPKRSIYISKEAFEFLWQNPLTFPPCTLLYLILNKLKLKWPNTHSLFYSWHTIITYLKDLNIAPKIIKLKYCKFLNTDLGDDFLALTPKIKATKAEINIRLKSFCIAKESKKKRERDRKKWHCTE